MGNLLWDSDRPEFVERCARLAGGTTYRVPVEGRGTRHDHLPASHAIAAALAMSRRGAQDVGPDVAYCIATGSDGYRRSVVVRLAEAIGGMGIGREIRHSRAHVAEACGAAWDAVVHQQRGVSDRRPEGCSMRAWDTMLLAAIGVLHDSAWDSLYRAERAYFGVDNRSIGQ